MLLRGGAVLVFKAWLGHVKDGENQLDKVSSMNYQIYYLLKLA